MRKKLIAKVMFLVILVSACAGCGSGNDETGGQAVQLETQEISDELNQVFAGEIEDFEQYKGIVDATRLQKFYNLDDEEQNSSLANALIRSFPQNEQFKYCQSINGDLYLFYLKKHSDKYYELVCNTKDGSCGIRDFDEVRAETATKQGADNIEREFTSYYLVSDGENRYIGRDARNITISETVDILKRFKGAENISEFADWDDPQEFLDKYYDEENGLQQDLRYAVEIEGTIYLCTINRAPQGYCLTYYDPQKDWFEVYQFKMLAKCMGGYYLLNSEESALKENSLENWQADGYLFICKNDN